MKKLVVKKEINLGFGRVIKKGEVVELQEVEVLNTSIDGIGIRFLRQYKVLVPNVGIGAFNENEFDIYFEEYKEKQIKSTKEIHINGLSEKVKIIRSDNATVVILNDGSKGVAKCLEEDIYDNTKGFEIAYTKACIKRLNKNLKELVK